MNFESTSHKGKADHLPPLFITSVLEDDSCVDRYIPSSLPLSIQEIDSHIGKFSFCTRDSVMQLLCRIRNMQLILACQVIQKKCSFGKLLSKLPFVPRSSFPMPWT
ncbi:transmembrane protein FLJ37396 [Patagioenas fasciata monilis]|uniref:Transmembrane protein FLJ37396 n=1 Tax=Patagioenas fasciata monilis TaxID=372326 RepID=A0A1V4JME9_PATFA|nr:transmembrane protein FLJ37396 [Patagioenas fasciata monilis]